MNPDDLLNNLTEPQRQAVTHAQGPLLVLAGAGSGKTRVITRRAAYLATTVTEPFHVLAITFTNKAAEEMRERVATLGLPRGMLLCTFHALCARLLRQHADCAGVAPNFSIFDQTDRKAAIKETLKRCDLNEKNWPPARIESRISSAKNQMMSPTEFAQNANSFNDRTLAKIYACYEQVMAEQNALDFDDLLLRTAAMLGRDEELRQRFEDRFHYVLVDEYQDTNHAQYVIARALTRERHNLCATGDPDQAIYGWRGADLNNILEFERDFPEATVVRLQQNYRSTQRILSVANAVIAVNILRKGKNLWTENPPGEKVQLREFREAGDEAAALADEVAALNDAGTAYADIAVFYRVNSLSRVLEDALRTAHIPYRIARGVEFYNRKEIKDAVAYLRILINPDDEVALRRVINTPPRGIGKTTIDRLIARARQTGHSLHDTLFDPACLALVGRSAARLGRFCELLKKLRGMLDGSVAELLKQTLKLSGLEAHYRALAEGENEQWENLAELINSAAEFDLRGEEDALAEFLAQISLVSDADMIDPAKGAVTLMTLHAAKGLEFRAVFIAGLEDGLIPHQRSENDDRGLEEERRLFFVGLTRAKERLRLSFARRRMVYGRSEMTIPSRFLQELPEEDVERIEADSDDHPNAFPRRGEPADFADWEEGELVRHPRHGLGMVLWIQAGPDATRAGVRFASCGEKTYILEYADLERIPVEDG